MTLQGRLFFPSARWLRKACEDLHIYFSFCTTFTAPTKTKMLHSTSTVKKRFGRHLRNSISAVDGSWAVADGAWVDLIPVRLCKIWICARTSDACSDWCSRPDSRNRSARTFGPGNAALLPLVPRQTSQGCTWAPGLL